MNRLTFWEKEQPGIVGMNQFNQDERIIEAVRLLAEYEDTGLEPMEVNAMVKFLNDLGSRKVKKLDYMLENE